ncbi:hypothetical protein ASPWEDRAFT_182759 [Aspergillus wentii DTO 134E9]|uniref:Uncharacterized protein n=1 Tax=Aspergillus wentii DTO 134E9 TaxID=1073089 RepID=A0A1L9RSW4_ASPWE|nr:uncharacterized protein ASPWEDRAFT_182759 [Aspergillus wentii DTO 134E9]OJJ37973.1 hypothetical protein ASPWEDRAFT_182759 [Aspergillus wentii DTO 134E9]
MFGTTVGPYLWNSVYEDMMRDRYNTIHGFISYWLPILSLALGAFYATHLVFSQKNRQENTKRMGFVLGGGLIVSGLLNYDLGDWGATLVIIGVVFSFLVCVQYTVVFLDPRKAS